MNSYLSLIFYLFCIVLMVATVLFLNKQLYSFSQKKRPTLAPTDDNPFECGVVPLQKRNTMQYPINYYKLAIMFVLFDLEGIFLYLWAIAAQPLSHFMFLTFILFIVILILIFAYILKEDFITPTKIQKGQNNE